MSLMLKADAIISKKGWHQGMSFLAESESPWCMQSAYFTSRDPYRSRQYVAKTACDSTVNLIRRRKC